jgi:uncharacterized protein
MSLSRRTLLGAGAAGAAFAGYARIANAQAPQSGLAAGYGPLRPDPAGIFDLPQGFSYRIISRAGRPMSDGLATPFKMDGMGAFPLGGSRLALVRNHELKPADIEFGPFGGGRAPAADAAKALAYDLGATGLPLPGGTTTLIYDTTTGRVEREHLSLVGTMINCAGGQTPWSSWLTCEETTLRAGDSLGRDHGWVFEVPAAASGLVRAEPVVGLGRFKHEAAAIDPATGVVYLTEDEGESLFYRFLPNDRSRLAAGGRLQALAFQDGLTDTRNWSEQAWSQGDRRKVRWIDLQGVDNPHTDLRLRGHAAGGAWFARGEGIHYDRSGLFFTCTSGGRRQLGQIMRYRPSRFEGRPEEKDHPGELELFVESGDRAVIEYGDNLTVAPWGDLIVCEDKKIGINHLKGVTPEGRVYDIGRNAMANPQGQPSNSELAGICVSPDATTLFVNIYWPGLTLAITGPWASFRV